MLVSRMGNKKIEIEGAGLPRRDPARNSVQDAGPDVKNRGMATQLVANLGRLGVVGVSAPAPHWQRTRTHAGQENLAPAENVHNKKPSLVALRKNRMTNEGYTQRKQRIEKKKKQCSC